MAEDYKLANISKRELALSEKRNEIINTSPENALDLILSSPSPAALVQSFPDEDLFFLVHHIGLEDSIPILALAASEQWGYMIDLEIWEKDRMNTLVITRWLKFLLLADNKRTVRWLLNERLEFIELYLMKNIEVIIREENQDPSEFPDGFFTFDDYFYVRIIEEPLWLETGLENEKETKEEREEIVRSFIDTLVSINIILYQNVMLESMSVIPSEVEEEDYRMRNVRLAEKGFMPFDDALGIFSSLSVKDFKKTEKKQLIRSEIEQEAFPVPLAYFAELNGKNHFTTALATIENGQELQLLQLEFASLCNHLISAEQIKIREKKELRSIVTKACGYLSLGLEALSEKNNTEDTIAISSLIIKYQLKDIFRVGYGLVMELKWKAEKFNSNGWFHDEGLALSFWGEQWLGAIGGLLVKRPLFFDNYKSGVLYRDFATQKDIVLTGKILETIKSFDDLLSMIAPDTEVFADNFLTCYNLLLSLWINKLVGRDLDNAVPLAFPEFKDFFKTLWEPGKRDFENPGKIKNNVKTEFLLWLSEKSGFTQIEISERLGNGLEAMFEEIENEYAYVHEKDLDPKYIHLFCINKKDL